MALTKVTTQMMSEVGAKAWVVYDQTNPTSITKSFNIASFTDLGTGQTQFTFTRNMASTDYGVVSSSSIDTASPNDGTYARSVSQFMITTYYRPSGTYTLNDASWAMAVVFGDQ